MSQSPNPASSPQPYGQSSATGQQAYAYAPAEPKGLSITSLIIGIASVFFGFTFLVPIAGIVIAVMARKREPAGRVMALWGLWLSIVMLVLGVLLWLLVGGAILASFGLIAASSV